MDQYICQGGHGLKPGGRQEKSAVVDGVAADSLLAAVVNVPPPVRGHGP